MPMRPGQHWAGRNSAAVLGSPVAAVILVIAIIRCYPSAEGLNRLYAGIFIGVAGWLAAIFWSLLADSGQQAWGRTLALAGIAGAALLLETWLRTASA